MTALIFRIIVTSFYKTNKRRKIYEIEAILNKLGCQYENNSTIITFLWSWGLKSLERLTRCTEKTDQTDKLDFVFLDWYQTKPWMIDWIVEVGVMVCRLKPASWRTYAHSSRVLSFPFMVWAIIIISNINLISDTMLSSFSSMTTSTMITLPVFSGIASLQFFKILMQSSSSQSCSAFCNNVWTQKSNG